MSMKFTVLRGVMPFDLENKERPFEEVLPPHSG